MVVLGPPPPLHSVKHNTKHNTVPIVSMDPMMQIAAGGTASSGGRNTVADDEVKMLLQGRKQFEKMTIGKGGATAAAACPTKLQHQQPEVVSSRSSSCSWLDAEMKNIQWPKNTSSMASWKETVNSFYQSTTAATDEDLLQSSIATHSKLLEPFLISTRRLLHRYPELMYEEKLTSQIVQRVLTEIGITNYSTGWAKNIHSKYYRRDGENNDEEVLGENDGGGHGIVVDLGSGQEPCILLRADMDALPILEQTPLPPDIQQKNLFHSNHHGKMHACGHDAHMTMLLGATYLLKSLQEEEGDFPFPGTIRIIFQPAEEGGAGAKRMREEGVLTNFPPVKHAFGMHVWPTLLSGQVGVRSGAMLAAQDNFTLILEGVGGHAAFPHLCRDPVVAAAAFVMNVQTLVSRGMNPLESGVVSVTQIDAGDGAHNVIPAKATIRGTIRALSDDALTQLRDGLIHIGSKTAEAHGLCLKSYEFAKDGYPATMNDDELFPFAAKCAGLVADTGKHTKISPTMGAEDFAFLAKGVPSAFFFLGQGGDGHEDAEKKSTCGKCCGRVPTNLGLHHPEFNLDEGIMTRGVALFLTLAIRCLKDLNEAKEGTDTTERQRPVTESSKSSSFRLRERELD